MQEAEWLSVGENRGKRKAMLGEMKRGRKKKRLLSGARLSVVSAEPQPENTDAAAVCISLPFTAVTPI